MMTKEEYINAINKNTNLDQDSVNIKAQKDLSFHEGYKLGRTDATNAYDESKKRHKKLGEELEENKPDRLAPFLCGIVASIVVWVFAKRWGFV